jgi:hypothetical protein
MALRTILLTGLRIIGDRHFSTPSLARPRTEPLCRSMGQENAGNVSCQLTVS